MRGIHAGLSHSKKLSNGEKRRKREASAGLTREKKKSFPCRIQKTPHHKEDSGWTIQHWHLPQSQ
jgi:hypothetical protein